MSKLVTRRVVFIISASVDCLGWSGEAIVTSCKEGTARLVQFGSTNCQKKAVSHREYEEAWEKATSLLDKEILI